CRRAKAVPRSGAIMLDWLTLHNYQAPSYIFGDHWTREVPPMRYLHTMLRVRNLDAALDFYCNKLGLTEVRRRVDDKNKYTLVFLGAPEDDELVAKGPATRQAPLVELTYNWDTEDYGEARHFGHLAYEVDDIYAVCERLMKGGVTINRPPRDGNMAFVRSPDKHSIELLQKGNPLPPKEPWVSMPNSGKWRHGPQWRFACPSRKSSLYVRRVRPSVFPSQRPSSSGPGRRPFTAETRVRFP